MAEVPNATRLPLIIDAVFFYTVMNHKFMSITMVAPRLCLVLMSLTLRSQD